MLISGPGFVLRPWGSPSDVEDLVRHGNNRAIWRNLTSRFPHPYTVEDAHSWLTIANAHPEDSRNLAIVVDGHAVGCVGFERQADLHRRTAEIGYWLGQDYWQRGLATAALRIATDLAFQSFDFVRLQAGVMSWNPASCRVAEKAGYELEARLRQAVWKDDAICDLLLYARLRR